MSVVRARARINCIVIATSIAALSLAGGAWAGGGGVNPSGPPELTDVRCIATCAGVRRATAGSRVELVGKRLKDVSTVSFDGGDSRIEVEPTATAKHSVKAVVPDGAITGRPRVEDSIGSDASPKELVIVDGDYIPEGGEWELSSADASPAKAYYYSDRDAAISYTFEGEATDVRIQVVRRNSGKVIRSWVEEAREPFVENTAEWNGRTDAGEPARRGKYRFELGPAGGDAPESTDDTNFAYYEYKFPVRGAHTYGDGIGAGRGHQGQDLPASCGTTVEAARGGKVQWRRYHSAAGYYLVIDGKGTGRDFVYMHMRKQGRPQEGAQVRTGERIGIVSDTGNATGCLLHFEIWSSPGWYEGGSFTNPTDDLKAWDKYS